jgi:hypothetical protein
MKISTDELPALIALIVAGKFKADAVDRAVAASPIVAAIADRAATELVEYQISKYGAAYKAHVLTWQDFKNHREEWTFACRYAAENFGREWHSWSSDKQRDSIDNLASPFKLDDEGRVAFIKEFLAY